jgi:F-type H+-transporting ATPase subunit delta
VTEGVAGRYASALFDLAQEQRSLDAVAADMTSLQRMLDESADLKRLVRSPAFSADDQGRAMKAILTKAGISGLSSNFIALVARNRRLFALEDMLKAFRALMARHRGEVAADVTSASPLSESQLSALRTAIGASTGKTIQLNTRVDPSILGGLIVKVGSRMVDSSLKTKLESLKTRMKEVR